MHLLPILKIAISIKMSVVWQSNCRPGCIQFAPAAWPRLAVVWNETSCVLISTLSGLLWKVLWTPTGVCAGFVSYGTESCLLQIFQAQRKIFLCAQLCHASQNTWNNSYLGSASLDFWKHLCLLDMDSSLIQVVEVGIHSEEELKKKSNKNATQIGVYLQNDG